jgi:hypothetical protein
MLAPADLKWGEGPPSLPPGAKMAVVYGDPSKTGLFILRAKVPANYKIPAHSHPTDETVTVLTDDPTPKTAAATPPAPPSKADAPTKK